MRKPDKGLLLVISGPSGSGKGTVLKELFKVRRNLYYSVSATTRASRPGEEHGKNYYFMTKEDFSAEIAGGNMLEYAVYCDNYYGTPKSAVEEMRERGQDVVLEIEVQGAMKVKKACKDAVTIFIMPPSVEELERRLRGRGTENAETIARRLETARNEIALARQYDYIVVNDIISEAAAKINAVITAEKLRSTHFGGGNMYA
jgi:guanylate kinase